MDIHHGDCQEETKKSVWPTHCHPSFLHTQWVHSKTIVIVNNIMIVVVVVDNFRVPERGYMLDSIDYVVSFFRHQILPKYCKLSLSS